jgi:transposase
MALEVKTKKGGPYTKQEQEKRRDEVFKLHFEYGYSARQISEVLKINRNTINSDISFLYSKLHDEMDKLTHDNWMNKQLTRLESQRVRLRKELDNDITLQERLQVEKVIFDLDSKISSLIIKMYTSSQEQYDSVVAILNNWMKEHDHEDRYMSQSSLYTIPKKSREKILQLLHSK